ncbi:hypothetical protein [Nitrosospira briensis]|uniref:hypothetical protein n=1 Tax=Nitrosospira briensis TaxID=35799 RepID=UPI0012E1665D|nr:hypothetical protein [Nitrosospira briensis]
MDVLYRDTLHRLSALLPAVMHEERHGNDQHERRGAGIGPVLSGGYRLSSVTRIKDGRIGSQDERLMMIPENWKLVPVEPDEKMLKLGCAAGLSIKALLDDAPYACDREDHPHLAPATLHNRLAYLKAAVRYAYKNHDIGDRDYTDKMIMPGVNNKRHVYIKQDELHENLLTHCEDDEAKAIFTLAFYTGLGGDQKYSF